MTQTFEGKDFEWSINQGSLNVKISRVNVLTLSTIEVEQISQIPIVVGSIVIDHKDDSILETYGIDPQTRFDLVFKAKNDQKPVFMLKDLQITQIVVGSDSLGASFAASFVASALMEEKW